MKKRLKYIVVLILLVIVPLSSIGFNIVIHKCKHSGIIQYAILTPSNSKSITKCCCSDCKSKENKEVKEISNCCNNLKKKESEKHYKTQNAEIDSINVTNCCRHSEVNKKVKYVQKQLNSELSKSPDKNSLKKYIHNQCCSTSEHDCVLNLVYISFNDNNLQLDFSLYSYIANPNYLNAKNNIDLSIYKNIKYPIKGPICQIISFIHYNSHTSEESDPFS